MAVQDFTTWTETGDSSNELTVTSSTATAAITGSSAFVYLVKDYGAGYFSGDFTFKITFTFTTIAGNYTTLPFDIYNDTDGIVVLGQPPSGAGDYALVLADYAFNYSDQSVDLTEGTTYYITFERSGTVYNCYIRTGSHTGTLVDTITIDPSTPIMSIQYINTAEFSSDLNGGAFTMSNLDDGISAGGTNTQINIGDTWKSIAGVQVNIGDVWKTVSGMQINIGDVWKTIF